MSADSTTATTAETNGSGWDEGLQHLVEGADSIPGYPKEKVQALLNDDERRAEALDALRHLAERPEQPAANNAQRPPVSEFSHPDYANVAPEDINTETDIFIMRQPDATTFSVKTDADSFYFVSSDVPELADALNPSCSQDSSESDDEFGSSSSWQFESITRQSSANFSSKLVFQHLNRPQRITACGKRPEYIDMKRMPNILLTKVQSPVAGIRTHVFLYYMGYNSVPASPTFTNEMVAVLNICLNLARKKGDLDSLGNFTEENRTSYDMDRSKMPSFDFPESRGKKGEPKKKN
jgi:hypothetical protein